MARRSRYNPPVYPEVEVKKRAEQIAARIFEFHQVPARPADLQRLERWYFEPRSGHWTLRYAWELTIDGVTGEVADELVSPVTPSKSDRRSDWKKLSKPFAKNPENKEKPDGLLGRSYE